MNYSTCSSNFQNLINRNYQNIDECIKIFADKLDRKNIYSSLLNGECISIGDKKMSYYNKTYDPAPIISEWLKHFSPEDKEFLLFNKMCDTSTYTNCCNCISVSLYVTKSTNYPSLSRFLFTIEQSIKNVKKFLNDWLYRLYLDPTVFELIANLKKHVETNPHDEPNKKLYSLYYNSLQNISLEPNCEIYFTLCDSFTSDTLTMGKRRNSRFNGFYLTDVNINASREADGIIDIMDCFNLRTLEFMPYSSLAYVMGSFPGTTYWSGYAKYGNFNDIFFSLSAGLFACKFKIKKTFFDERLANTLENLRKLSISDFQAFDEFFLAELFKDFMPLKDSKYKLSKLFGLVYTNETQNHDQMKIKSSYATNLDLNFFDKISNGLFNEVYMTVVNNNLKYSDCLEKNPNFYSNDFLTKLVDYYRLWQYKYGEKEEFFVEKFGKMLIISNIIWYYFSNYNTHEIFQHELYYNPGKFFICEDLWYSLNILSTNPVIFVNKDSTYDFELNELLVEMAEITRNSGNNLYWKKSEDVYKNKYLKYKNKYLKLKKNY
jgi:hypothetical protein